MPTPRKYVNIEIRGVTYRDAEDAGKALGVGAQAVRLAARRGTLHRVGLGKSGKEPMRVQVGGRVFKDAHEAAKHFGVKANAVWNALAAGDPDRLLRGKSRKGIVGKRFEVGGLTFASLAEASETLGFSRGYVSLALRRKSVPMMQRILGEAMRLRANQEAGVPHKRRAVRKVSRPVVVEARERPVPKQPSALAEVVAAAKKLQQRAREARLSTEGD